MNRAHLKPSEPKTNMERLEAVLDGSSRNEGRKSYTSPDRVRFPASPIIYMVRDLTESGLEETKSYM